MMRTLQEDECPNCHGCLCCCDCTWEEIETAEDWEDLEC